MVSSDVFSHQLTVLNVDKFVENLNKCNICNGNNDFENLVKKKLEKSADLFFLLRTMREKLSWKP